MPPSSCIWQIFCPFTRALGTDLSLVYNWWRMSPDKRLQESRAFLSASILSMKTCSSARSVRARCPISEPLPLGYFKAGTDQADNRMSGTPDMLEERLISSFCVVFCTVCNLGPTGLFFADSIHAIGCSVKPVSAREENGGNAGRINDIVFFYDYQPVGQPRRFLSHILD